jgi:hypothetical protein
VSAILKTDIISSTASTLTLISDKTTTTKTSFSDNSGILTRTIIDAGEIKEEAVASTINAKEIILNGNSLLAEKLEKDQLLKTISSEYNLNEQQIIQVKAILNSREWYDKTTTMSQLGSIIVAVVVAVCTAGAGLAAVGAVGISNATLSTAVAASIDAMVVSATTQVVSGAITGDMKLNYKDMLRSAALAGALSVVTTTIDTKMGYNKIDPSTGKQVVLSYGDKISREMLHGLATKAVYGGDIETIMASSAGNVAFDYIAHDVYAKNPDFPVPKTLTHALIGGTLSELAGGDFSQGAISTAVAHVVADALVNQAMDDIASGKVTIENNPEAINAYIKNLNVQVEAVSSAVAGAVTLATHENVTDEELAISQDMAKSVVKHNDLEVVALGVAALARGAIAGGRVVLPIAGDLVLESGGVTVLAYLVSQHLVTLTPSDVEYLANVAQTTPALMALDLGIIYAKGDKMLSPGEVEKLKKNGFDPEAMKDNVAGRDLYKDKKGNIVIKRKGGKGDEGEPTGVNLNDLRW